MGLKRAFVTLIAKTKDIVWEKFLGSLAPKTSLFPSDELSLQLDFHCCHPWPTLLAKASSISPRKFHGKALLPISISRDAKSINQEAAQNKNRFHMKENMLLDQSPLISVSVQALYADTNYHTSISAGTSIQICIGPSTKIHASCRHILSLLCTHRHKILLIRPG